MSLGVQVQPIRETSDKSTTDDEKDMWSALLDSLATKSNKVIETKSCILLGSVVPNRSSAFSDSTGSSPKIADAFVSTIRDCQKIGIDKRRRRSRRVSPPFGSSVGYAYIDLEDHETEGKITVIPHDSADVTDVLARLEILHLSRKDKRYNGILEAFIKSRPTNDIVICILLDWHEPWKWLRDVRLWLRRLMRLIAKLRKSSREADADFQEIISALELKVRSYSETRESTSGGPNASGTALPLSDGQFDIPLGLPLICVAQNVCSDSNALCMLTEHKANHTFDLERQSGMREEHFDYIQQILRTILMHHGGSLHYLTSGVPATNDVFLKVLLQSHIPGAVADLLSRDIEVKAEVLKRDQVFVPVGWDSWNKIRYQRDGFDVEHVAKTWAQELEDLASDNDDENMSQSDLVDIYEQVIKDKSRRSIVHLTTNIEPTIPFTSQQDFLAELYRQVEANRPAHSKSGADSPLAPLPVPTTPRKLRSDAESRIVPGTILMTPSKLRSDRNIDPDEIEEKLRILRERNLSLPSTPGASGKISTPKDEYVQAFFQNLLSRTRED